jgi:hypothetical protein
MDKYPTEMERDSQSSGVIVNISRVCGLKAKDAKCYVLRVDSPRSELLKHILFDSVLHMGIICQKLSMHDTKHVHFAEQTISSCASSP